MKSYIVMCENLILDGEIKKKGEILSESDLAGVEIGQLIERGGIDSIDGDAPKAAKPKGSSKPKATAKPKVEAKQNTASDADNGAGEGGE